MAGSHTTVVGSAERVMLEAVVPSVEFIQNRLPEAGTAQRPGYARE
ncbi:MULTISPECIES: hypothetical protein [Paenarthrobacter]|nr:MULTISPECIES: hypothetical protein [Paenarthrobacter]MDD7835521.1 hypothetical protein [Paenarthrobacter sp. AB444]MDP9936184.1 hypothetical protein [Paenarthrobacter nicotinovorans]UXM90887.1 hypothetical protein N5P29_16545 [Paenarthrobacter sp. JL.01a]